MNELDKKLRRLDKLAFITGLTGLGIIGAISFVTDYTRQELPLKREKDEITRILQNPQKEKNFLRRQQYFANDAFDSRIAAVDSLVVHKDDSVDSLAKYYDGLRKFDITQINYVYQNYFWNDTMR